VLAVSVHSRPNDPITCTGVTSVVAGRVTLLVHKGRGVTRPCEGVCSGMRVYDSREFLGRVRARLCRSASELARDRSRS